MHQNSRVCHIWSRQTQKPTTTNHQIGTNHSTIWANDKLDWARNENKTTKTNCGSCVTVPNQITPTLTYTFCRNVVCIFIAREKKSMQAPRHFRPSERENVHWFFQLAQTMTRLNCWAIRCTFAGAACALDARAFHIQHSPSLCSVAPPFDTSLSRCVAMAHTGLSYSLTLAVFVGCSARGCCCLTANICEYVRHVLPSGQHAIWSGSSSAATRQQQRHQQHQHHRIRKILYRKTNVCATEMDIRFIFIRIFTFRCSHISCHTIWRVSAVTGAPITRCVHLL